MQESRYNIKAINQSCGYAIKHQFHMMIDITNTKCVVNDIGIAQINVKTIKAYKFDIGRLMNDLEYSVDAGANVLSWFRKVYSKKEPLMWYSRYNCGTKRNVNRTTCNNYKRLVSKYL